MIKADFSKCNALFLSYPKGFLNEYESLVPFYNELINLIPDQITLFVVVNKKQIEKELRVIFGHKPNLQIVLINYWDEIWLRDCMGQPTNNGGIIRPIYSPKYCTLGKECKYFQYLDKLSRQIIRESVNADIIDLPLVIDGGNFVHNTQKVFLTNKVVEDNPGKDVKAIIKQYTGLDAIIVERNYYDVMGHIDGYLAFKDDSTVFVSEYPNLSYLKKDIKYVKMLKSAAQDNGFKVIPMFDRPMDEPLNCECRGKKKRGCFYSAKGIYVNYIRFNNYIIMPEYTLPTGSEIEYNWMNKKLLNSYGFDVLTINCDRLAKFGGSLHCISFQI